MAFFYIAFIVLLAYFSNALVSKDHITTLLTTWGYKQEFLLPLMIYFILFKSVVEEIFWRGFLFTQYKYLSGNTFAALMISLFFIQYHFVTVWHLISIQTAIVFTVLLFCVNIFWCSLRIKYNNIYATIISHLFADLAIMFVYYQYVLH